MKQSKKDGWAEYAQAKKRSRARKLLQLALKHDRLKGGIAVDLGSGPGGDTLYLLNRGYIVHSVDSSPISIALLQKRLSAKVRDRSRIHQQAMPQFVFPKASIINASYSLPFLSKRELKRILNRIQQSLVRRGLFSAHLFGPEDDWAGSRNVTVLTKKEIKTILSKLTFIRFKEIKKRRPLVTGGRKNWHIFEVIGRKR